MKLKPKKSNSVPPNNNQWSKIQINPNLYKAKVTFVSQEQCYVQLDE